MHAMLRLMSVWVRLGAFGGMYVYNIRIQYVLPDVYTTYEHSASARVAACEYICIQWVFMYTMGIYVYTMCI